MPDNNPPSSTGCQTTKVAAVHLDQRTLETIIARVTVQLRRGGGGEPSEGSRAGSNLEGGSGLVMTVEREGE